MTKEQLMFEAEVYNKGLTNHPKSVQELTEVLAGFGERLQLLQQTPCNTQCEHQEVMRQGNGFVYGVCSKCGIELY